MRLFTLCACFGFALLSDFYQGEAYGRGHHRRAKSQSACCPQPVTCDTYNYGSYDKGHATHGFAAGGSTGNANYVAGGINGGTGLAARETHGLVDGGRIGNTIQNRWIQIDGQSLVAHGIGNGFVQYGDTGYYVLPEGHKGGNGLVQYGDKGGHGLNDMIVYNPDGTIGVDGRTMSSSDGVRYYPSGHLNGNGYTYYNEKGNGIVYATNGHVGGDTRIASGSFGGNGFVSQPCGCGN
jgi:hypothetical protein